MIVHAIQSLWARSLSEDYLDPDIWLREVNDTLLRLGEREAHSATIGMFVITPQQVTYWSAGHLPAWFVSQADKERHIDAILGRGNMLGIKSKLTLHCKTYTLPEVGGILIFGSDGVFDRGTRNRRRDIFNILDTTLKNNALPLELCTVEDDRTLVLVEFKNTLRKAA